MPIAALVRSARADLAARRYFPAGRTCNAATRSTHVAEARTVETALAGWRVVRCPASRSASRRAGARRRARDPRAANVDVDRHCQRHWVDEWIAGQNEQ